MTPNKPLFYVSHIGHKWATQAVDFKSEEEAVRHAKESCTDAIQTLVYDCTHGPVGTLILKLNSNGNRIQ